MSNELEREAIEMFDPDYQPKKRKWYQFDFIESKAKNCILIFVLFIPIIFLGLTVIEVMSIYVTWIEGFFRGGTVIADSRVNLKVERLLSAGLSVLMLEKLLYSIFMSTFITIVNWFSD